MKKEIALGFVRHVLTAVGGMVAATGYIGSGDIELVVGAVVTIVGVAWSAYDKYKKV